MPTPRKGEKRKDFIARCIPMLIEEGRKSDQAVAICNSIWDNRKKSLFDLKRIIKKMFGYIVK